MTREEKFNAIMTRAGVDKPESFTPFMLSEMMIGYYLAQFVKLGLFEGDVFPLTAKGERFARICDEFEWEILPAEAAAFVTVLIEEEYRIPAYSMIMFYQQDREKFLSIVEQCKKEINE